MRQTPIALLAACAVLAAPSVAGATDPLQHPPKLPSKRSGAKKACGQVKRKLNGSTLRWKVYVIKGSVTCAKAKGLIRHVGQDVGDWTYIDWTKGGNGPWSDVYSNQNRKVVAGDLFDY